MRAAVIGTKANPGLFVRDAVGHVAGGYTLRSATDMGRLIVEENIRTEGFQKLRLGHAAEEQRLIDSDMPGAQGANDAFMRGRTA